MENEFWTNRIKALGDHISEEFPGLAYVTFIMPFNSIGNASYISNADRNSIISMLRDTVRTFEKEADKSYISGFDISDEEMIDLWESEFYNRYSETIDQDLHFDSIAIGFFIAKGATPERAILLYNKCIEKGVY